LGQLTIHPLNDIPLVREGDDLAEMLILALRKSRITATPGDVLVVAQKIVSKAEGRKVRLADLSPGTEAVRIA